MENKNNLTNDQIEKVNGGDGNDVEMKRPKCPKCGSTNVGAHVEGGMIWGFHCFNCGYEW